MSPDATPRSRTLKVGGVTPFTATDYPGQLAAAVFVQGCPWRCGYCHNPHLQTRTAASPIAWSDVLALLRRRVGLIDAVVFSGGEPCMDPQLGDAIAQLRALGFKIGMHSGGTHPTRLKSVLSSVDWLGLDIKAGFADYSTVTGVANSGRPALASLETVLASGIAYEVRTTAHPVLLPESALLRLARTLSDMQVANYTLQVFRAQGCSDARLNATMSNTYPSTCAVEQIARMFPNFQLRRG